MTSDGQSLPQCSRRQTHFRVSRRCLGPNWQNPTHRTCRGFTLPEALVSLAIVATLMALLLPAIHSSREAARRTQCKNNLKEIGIAFALHLDSTQRYPTNGWGYGWIGDPDRGTDRHQPGGWIYCLLPYVEQNSLRYQGAGTPDFLRPSYMSTAIQTPLPLFRCPSRPGVELLPANPNVRPVNALWRSVVAKTDYAVNEGDYITNTTRGPLSLADGDKSDFPWTDVSKATGICFLRSEVRPSDLGDGLSTTILAGEKRVSSNHYSDDGDDGHDQSLLSGVDLDLNRWVISPPLRDGPSTEPRRFGSAHSAGCNMLFCDGSVRGIDYSVDQQVFRHAGHRNDGE